MIATSEASLASRARRLAALARDVSGAQEAVQTETRTRNALVAVDSKVRELEAQVGVWRALVDGGIALPVAPDLLKDANDLETYVASSGRPTPERLRAAAKRIEGRIEDLSSKCLAPWQEWAQRQLSQIDVSKVPLVPQPQQSLVSQRLASLALDAKNAPSLSSVVGFSNTVSIVVETLDSIETSSTHEASGLAKLTAAIAVTLSDFSREEVIALHANSDLARQIQLRRR